ncbi:Zn-ribbon domain-containing OB-fold protein [Streptomyces sp. HUAS TT20]|uniref:Zn-ribbon domain-containing OB-fold protein n=1 Tax=Streptomyces sp. HUAS TT20 TaxID=3447509 RepID=UPI0021DA19AA|nr:OB-fold domain-containing protein [Streptomyces sp. HUAS 15-9]UXY32841.1 OB-fold domain-containing protein [Streptomyces sp. HUAS 15-9]
MYHHSGSVVHSAAGSATSVLDPVSAPVSASKSASKSVSADTRDAIVYQRCTWCGTAMYQRLLCPVCQGSELRTERSEGTGTVRHSTVVHRNTPAARNVSLIEMAEGFVVRGRVMGHPVGIHSGDRVRLSTAKDPVRSEPVFQLLDEPYRAWT